MAESGETADDFLGKVEELGINMPYTIINFRMCAKNISIMLEAKLDFYNLDTQSSFMKKTITISEGLEHSRRQIIGIKALCTLKYLLWYKNEIGVEDSKHQF